MSSITNIVSKSEIPPQSGENCSSKVFQTPDLASLILVYLGRFKEFECTCKENLAATRTSHIGELKIEILRLKHFGTGEPERQLLYFLEHPLFFDLSNGERESILEGLTKSLPRIEGIDAFFGRIDRCVNALRGTTKFSAQIIGKFCHSLANQLSLRHKAIWAIYRVLEKFYPFGQEVEVELRRFLEGAANKELKVCFVKVPGSERFRYIDLDIHPRWFGGEGNRYSLCGNGERGIPLLMEEVLWARIEKIKEENPDWPIQIGISPRCELPYPRDFTLSLCERVLEAGIYLGDSFISIGNHPFKRAICTLSEGELSALPQGELAEVEDWPN